MGICLILRGQYACQDGLEHFLLEKDLTTLQNSRNKCVRVPVWVRGRGSNCQLGNAQMNWFFFKIGTSLWEWLHLTTSQRVLTKSIWENLFQNTSKITLASVNVGKLQKNTIFACAVCVQGIWASWFIVFLVKIPWDCFDNVVWSHQLLWINKWVEILEHFWQNKFRAKKLSNHKIFFFCKNQYTRKTFEEWTMDLVKGYLRIDLDVIVGSVWNSLLWRMRNTIDQFKQRNVIVWDDKYYWPVTNK